MDAGGPPDPRGATPGPDVAERLVGGGGGRAWDRSFDYNFTNYSFRTTICCRLNNIARVVTIKVFV